MKYTDSARNRATLNLRRHDADISDFDRCMASSWQQLRDLHEEGELDFDHVCSRWAYEGAFDDLDDVKIDV